MSEPNEQPRDEFVADLVGGELSPDAPEVVRQLAEDPELAEEVEALLALTAGIEGSGSLRAFALDAASEGDEEEHLQGFRDHIQSAAPPARSAHPPKLTTGPRLARTPARGWLFAAAGILVLVAGGIAVRMNLSQPVPAGPESRLYLDGDASILVGPDLPFGTVQWTLSANDLFSRVSVRAYSMDSSAAGAQETLLAEFDELSVDRIELTPEQLSEHSTVQFVIEVQADGEPLPRRMTVTQER